MHSHLLLTFHRVIPRASIVAQCCPSRSQDRVAYLACLLFANSQVWRTVSLTIHGLSVYPSFAFFIPRRHCLDADPADCCLGFPAGRVSEIFWCSVNEGLLVIVVWLHSSCIRWVRWRASLRSTCLCGCRPRVQIRNFRASVGSRKSPVVYDVARLGFRRKVIFSYCSPCLLFLSWSPKLCKRSNLPLSKCRPLNKVPYG
jgi:hypothetical protein